MRAGKPAFLEKPLAITLEQLQEVEQVWRETGGRVLVGYNRRFSPFVRQIAEHFRNRTEPLSILYRVNAGPLEQGHWMRATPEGGSRVVSEGCHFIDVMMFLTNSLPKRVCAAHLRSYEPDTAQLVIEFEDGSVGVLYYLTTGDPSVPKEYLEVHGAGRSAILRDFRELELIAGGKHTTHKTAGQDKGHKNELQAFVEAVKGGNRNAHPAGVGNREHAHHAGGCVCGVGIRKNHKRRRPIKTASPNAFAYAVRLLFCSISCCAC
jgi:predicted dehydrogenase